MPTLSNEELKQQIDKIFFSKYNALHDNFFKSEFEASKEAANDVLKLFATQNTALLKEVAKALPKPLKVNKTVGGDGLYQEGYNDALGITTKLINSKLAAMGVDDAK